MPEDTRTSAAPVITATRRNLCCRVMTLPLLRRLLRRALLRARACRGLARLGLSRAGGRRASRFLCRRRTLAGDTLRQFLSARLAVPLFERFVRNLAFDQQLRKLAPLRLALERHLVGTPRSVFGCGA